MPKQWLSRTDLGVKDKKRVANIIKPTQQFEKAEKFENMQGGAATSQKHINRDAFSQSSANLTFQQEMDFKLGNALFRKLWVSSPSSTHASDGLGPLFNARACQSCHIKDGRGHPPEGDSDATSMTLHLARPAKNQSEYSLINNYLALNFPDNHYGLQLQDLAVPGLASEGKITISYQEKPITLGDGTIISLRQPTYHIKNLAYGDLGKTTTMSPRIANQMIGLGLLEAIHPADIIALSDPNDDDNDGVSGRPAIIRDHDSNHLLLGRFGWKAQNASIRTQNAHAFTNDIGIQMIHQIIMGIVMGIVQSIKHYVLIIHMVYKHI